MQTDTSDLSLPGNDGAPTGEGLYLTLYALLYFLAFTPMILIQGPLWDDWVWTGTSDRFDLWLELGRPYQGYLFDAVHELDGVLSASRVMTFAAYFLAGIALFKTLVTARLFSQRDAFWVALLTIVAPLNVARVIEANLFYTLSFLAFCLSLFCLARYFKGGAAAFRILALVFLFLSFFIPSFLVMTAIPLLFIYYRNIEYILPHGGFRVHVAGFLKVVLKHLDFHLLPLVFLAVKFSFFAPFGRYAGYNAITLFGLIKGVAEAVKTGIYNVFMLLSPALKELLTPLDSNHVLTEIAIIAIVSFMIVLLVPFLAGERKFLLRPGTTNHDDSRLLWGLAGAFSLLVLAIYPYVVVNKFPHPIGVASRHQQTLQLFMGAVVFFGVKLLVRPRIAYGALAVAASLFVAENSLSYVSYLKHSHVQNALISEMRKSSKIRSHRTFVFDDNSRPNRAFGDTARYFELSHLMAEAFGNQERMGLSYFPRVTDWRKLAEKYAKKSGQGESSGVRDYKPDGQVFLVRIIPGPQRLTMTGALSLAYDQIFDQDAYAKGIQGLVRLAVDEIDVND